MFLLQNFNCAILVLEMRQHLSLLLFFSTQRVVTVPPWHSCEEVDLFHTPVSHSAWVIIWNLLTIQMFFCHWGDNVARRLALFLHHHISTHPVQCSVNLTTSHRFATIWRSFFSFVNKCWNYVEKEMFRFQRLMSPNPLLCFGSHIPTSVLHLQKR